MKEQNIMKTRTLGHPEYETTGNSDISITPVGFGAWAIGGSGWEFAWGAQMTTRPSRDSSGIGTGSQLDWYRGGLWTGHSEES